MVPNGMSGFGRRPVALPGTRLHWLHAHPATGPVKPQDKSPSPGLGLTAPCAVLGKPFTVEALLGEVRRCLPVRP